MTFANQYDHITLDLTDKQLHLILRGEQLTTTLDGVEATIACGDSATECNARFAAADFSGGGVLVLVKRDVIGRLLDGTIRRMGAYVYDRDDRVLGNLRIHMIVADPTPEEMAADGSDALARIWAIAAEPARR